ncbi:nuclear transport factor 2 family protein [Streptomyces luteolus]|uniref:Nuclear transport factor 2 family protein n=1 Tax=Streptomyces luteolus TaxID=3043615 RepID=A0ABT6SSG3_9ACTN|nr:nuclear transport factor 2 family protein [Streptomyces sp. B-S-A12]MDI3418518.1 nuclear transport factor 2 family protein [Streptomyces sp. B-S-A12]
MKLTVRRPRRSRLVVIVVAAVLVLGGAALSNDYVRAVTTEAMRSTPEEHDKKTLDSLQPAVRTYVDAVNSKDVDRLVGAFHPEGEAGDTGRSFHGREEIRDWASDEVIGGELTVLAHTPAENGSNVLVRFANGGLGAFRAHYEFALKDGLIHRVSMSYA